MHRVEAKLDEIFVKNAPVQIPENAKKTIVQYMPLLSIVIGVLGLLVSALFWNGAQKSIVVDNGIGISFYLTLLSLVVQSLILILAYPGLREKSKSRGWSMVFYALLVGVAYSLCNSVYYGSLLSLLAPLSGFIIGLYVLFQIRAYYNGHRLVGKLSDEKIEKNTSEVAAEAMERAS